MESPPTTLPRFTRLLRPLTFARERASPALPEWTVRWSPPRPPSPPVTFVLTAFATSPVVPDAESEWDSAPELAMLKAAPATWALPVSPVLPESPLRTAAVMLPVPLIPVLAAVRSPRALPVLPESPESPLAATGLASAVDVAGPVLPVLVALDCAHAVPESPD